MIWKNSLTGLLGIFLLMGCAFTERPETNNEPDPAESEPIFTRSIIAFGDSLTEGYGLDPEESYPAQLQQKLIAAGYGEYEVINAGVSGETSSGALARTDFIIDQRPDIVVFEIGGNDGLRGVDPALTRRNIDMILSKLTAADIAVLFAGMKITENLGREYVEQFQSIYPELAAKHDVPFLPFFLEGVAGKQSLNLPDEIHPNAEGYRIIVEENIFPLLEVMLR